MRPPQTTGLPLLDRGSHLGPEQGACLMELASILAGERFSDAPRSVHPLIAAVARAVNDTVDEEWLPRLSLLVPEAIGTSVASWPADPALAALVAATARQYDEGSTRAAAVLRRARRRTDRARRGGPWDRFRLWSTRRSYRRRAIDEVTALACDVVAHGGAVAGEMLLQESVGVCQRRAWLRSMPWTACRPGLPASQERHPGLRL